MKLLLLRRSIIASLLTAAGTFAVMCDAVETLGRSTPAPAAALPEPGKGAGRQHRRRTG